MEITMLDADNPERALIEFDVAVSAEEADTLAQGAYRRIASALHVSDEQARERAKDMLTAMELNVLIEETVKARAADRAIQQLGIAFMLEPSAQSTLPCQSGCPYALKVSAHPIPRMELDLETPVDTSSELKDALGQAEVPAASSEKIRTHIKRTLRARLQGTIPASLESAAIARENKAFRRGLKDDGETYREYRIRTGKKPQEVEADLRRRAMRQLYDELALETVFRERGLTTTAQDEAAVLSEMAPGRESALREELDNAGKLWMLAQEARRKTALDWAIENLAQ